MASSPIEPNRVLRIAIFRHTLFLGSEQFIPLQASALPCDVTMVARDQVRNPIEGLATRSLMEQGNTAVYRHMAGDSRPLASLLREVRSEIVHAHFGVEGMYSLASARALGVPHFTTFHGFDATRTRRSLVGARNVSWLKYAVGRGALLRSETHAICVSRHVQDTLIQMGASPERTVVVGTGVDTSLIRPSPQPERPTVLHVARLVEKKGTEYLLDAFSQVRAAVPGARLRILGDGPLRGRLEQQAESLGIAPSVSFEGAVSHARVLEALADSSLLCLPSVRARSGDEEGLGQVLLEAGAAGRPVVATRNGGIVDAVRDGKTGFLVNEREVGPLAERLIEVLGNAGLAARLGAAGRTLVSQEFDAHRQAEKLAAEYQRAVSGSS